ncbi:23S rRNA (uracil-C(5))-methyltransferase RlmCD [Legionella rubrilucens]|uniref:23S rRNA (Uracil-C(5))-methyltransferase RlmCD n=1 Tax=Legionella rubrilucens TaxID=458 RepID=A0A0W0XQF4_9GAMM|nr:methyltransferase domain-containing protein [Legionella rubrilucens]KTD46627.1 23S rRNA (uracil-C(5))-methyltransferase RlmCD [Legionella rubrilucens]
MSYACPFGPRLQVYWERRYDFFHRFDEGIQFDAEGLHTVMPEQAALAQAQLFHGADCVLDGFCGVGGAAIALARLGKKVIAVELDAHRLNMARHNARIYGVDEAITFVHGDFFEVARQYSADALLVDPPWGWPRYRPVDRFLLEHFEPHGKKVLDFALSRCNQVILRAPVHFDTTELELFGVNYQSYDNLLHERVISKSILLYQKSLKG